MKREPTLRSLIRSVQDPWWHRASDWIHKRWRCHVRNRHQVKFGSHGLCIWCHRRPGARKPIETGDALLAAGAALYAWAAALWALLPPRSIATAIVMGLMAVANLVALILFRRAR